MKNKRRMKPKIINKNINVSPQNRTRQHPTEAEAQTDVHHLKHHQLYQPTNAGNPSVENKNHLNDADDIHPTNAEPTQLNDTDEIHQNVADTNHLNGADIHLNAVVKSLHHRGGPAHTYRLQGLFANQDQERPIANLQQGDIRHISTNQNYHSTTKRACQIRTNFVTPF
jgi:hypothetical protein